MTESSKLVKNENKLTLNFSKSEILNLEALKSICGGNDEGNGGGNIFILPKF